LPANVPIRLVANTCHGRGNNRACYYVRANNVGLRC